MRRLLILLASLASQAHAAPTPPPVVDAPVLTTTVEGDLGLDPTGAVEFYRVSSDVPQAVAAKTQELVRQMKFEPVIIDGRPVRAHARMRATLVGTPIGQDRFNMQLDGFSFPEEAPASATAPRPDDVRLKVDRKSNPRYPEIAGRIGVDADVVVLVKIARDGAIAEASIAQSAMLGAAGDRKVVAKLLGEFELQSLRAVRSWHVAVDVPDGVKPTDAQMTAAVVMRFRMFGHPDQTPAGEWQWLVRSRKRPAPWLPPDAARPMVGVADVGGADLLAPANGFRLASPLPQQAL